MSRIGKKPVQVLDGVKVIVKPGAVDFSGPKGNVSIAVHPNVKITLEDKLIRVTRCDDTKLSKALHGLFRAMTANAVEGVTKGYEKRLDIVGTGYNAKLRGKHIDLSVGNVSPATLEIPNGLLVEVPMPTKVIIKGADKQMVGQFAAQVRAVRKPEPYKGKGIMYEGEVIRRKAGKSFGSGS